MFGHTYTKPPINLPEKWPSKHNVQGNEHLNLPYMMWWKQFNSPELNAFIEKALQHNGLPKIAVANIDYAHSQLEQVKLNWIPNMTLLTGFSQFPILGNPGNTIIAYPLYIVNILQLYKQQKSAKAIYEASIYANDCAKIVVIAQTSTGFFTLIAQTEAISLYTKLLSDYRIYLKLAISQYRAGLTDEDNVYQLRSQIRQIQSQIDITEHNIAVSKNALHYLFNESPGNLTLKKSFKTINSNGVIPGNLPVSVLNARPDILAAEALLRASHADIGAVAANLLPSITLGAYLGKGSSLNGPIKLGEAYLNTPVIDLPVFAEISANKARYKALYIKYIVTVKEALRDVDNDLSAYWAYSSQLNNTIAAFTDEQQHCHLAERRFHHGINNNIDVIQCKIKLIQFELMINQSKLKKMLAIVTLYQDLAGGYRGA